MRNLLIAAAIACAAGAGHAQKKPDPGTEITRTVTAAKARLERQLKDPSSVQYRDLFVARRDKDGAPELVLCGQVNAKNSMGGYGGFHTFISAPDLVYMEDQIAAILPEFCGNKIAGVK